MKVLFWEFTNLNANKNKASREYYAVEKFMLYASTQYCNRQSSVTIITPCL
jgi:hypothetical protein